MAEAQIKRVNFFDGQFLKQGEFLGLENYHRHMRRRLLHMLFDQSGVVQLSAADLRVVVTDAAQKLITVNAGTAISKRDGDIVEAKEVVLRENLPIDLDTVVPPLVPGDMALVTIHYAEQSTDPSSEGGVLGDTRVTEQAVVTVHRNALPTPPNAPNGEPYIRLGDVNFQFMTVPDETNRREAHIRSALLGVTPGPGPSPTISAIAPATGDTGTTVNAHVTGTNLNGASAISFPGAPGILMVGSLTAVTTTGFDVQLSIGAVIPGTYQFNVTLPGGAVNSSAITFTVSVVVTVATVIPTAVNIQTTAPAGLLTVRGTNIRDAALATGAAATGTVVRLVRASDVTQVIATCTNPIVLPNVGANQAIQVTLPLAADFSAQVTPARVRVEFGGGTGTGTQNITLNYV